MFFPHNFLFSAFLCAKNMYLLCSYHVLDRSRHTSSVTDISDVLFNLVSYRCIIICIYKIQEGEIRFGETLKLDSCLGSCQVLMPLNRHLLNVDYRSLLFCICLQDLHLNVEIEICCNCLYRNGQ